MELLLVRHGQTFKNAKHMIDTAAPGSVLTETGWTQANDVVAKLVTHGVGAIWASNLERTSQTATPLATRLGMEIQIHPGFREIAAGDFEDGADEVAYDGYVGTINRWLKGELDYQMPGTTESGYDTLARFESGLAAVESSGVDCAVIFSHAAMMTFWVAARVAGAASEDYVPIYNTGIVHIKGNLETGYSLESWLGI